MQRIVSDTIPFNFITQEAELSAYCEMVSSRADEALISRWYNRIDPENSNGQQILQHRPAPPPREETLPRSGSHGSRSNDASSLPPLSNVASATSLLPVPQGSAESAVGYPEPNIHGHLGGNVLCPCEKCLGALDLSDVHQEGDSSCFCARCINRLLS